MTPSTSSVPADEVFGGGQIAATNASGTSGDDALQGTSGDDFLYGLEGNDRLLGLAGADGLYGGDGNDYLDSGPVGDGADYLVGGLGDDEYVAGLGDSIVENAGEGFDTIRAPDSFILNAFAEIEVLSTTDNAGTADLYLVGNEFGQAIYGNAGSNYLDGAGGADILYGLGGNDAMIVDDGDIVIEAVGGGTDNVAARTTYILNEGAAVEDLSTSDHTGTEAINLFGNEFGQSLTGNDGDNYLDGGGSQAGGARFGPDILQGRRGNDVMVVSPGDVVRENVGEGFDTVAARSHYNLTPGAEIELLRPTDLLATTNLRLTGNAFGQTIYGNKGPNLLDGGGGADILWGFEGNDEYFVDADDIVMERGPIGASGEGVDIVRARTSYILNSGASVEVLQAATEAFPIHLVGNEFGQRLVGNGLDNYLDGGGGDDFLDGSLGDDVFIVDLDDVVLEFDSVGFDTVAARTSFALTAFARVEVLMTTDQSATTALNLIGNEFRQVVAGNEGANILDGDFGGDLLLGFGGADTFRFTTRLDNRNIDTIGDMVSGVDKIALSALIFTGLSTGTLPASAFVLGTSAQDADDRIIYDPATGNLLFDADGNGSGGAIHFAILQGAPTIAASDFLVI